MNFEVLTTAAVLFIVSVLWLFGCVSRGTIFGWFRFYAMIVSISLFLVGCAFAAQTIDQSREQIMQLARAGARALFPVELMDHLHEFCCMLLKVCGLSPWTDSLFDYFRGELEFDKTRSWLWEVDFADKSPLSLVLFSHKLGIELTSYPLRVYGSFVSALIDENLKGATVGPAEFKSVLRRAIFAQDDQDASQP